MKRLLFIFLLSFLTVFIAGAIAFKTQISKPVLAASNIVYNNIPTSIPGNVPSLGYEATSTSEFGGQVSLAGAERENPIITVLMSSWACQSGSWNTGTCVTTEDATFSHPITLKIYNVNPDNSVGTVIASNTITFDMPYRPSADPSCGDGRWSDGENCFNGKAFPISFTFNGITLPDNVIIGVSYNTSHYGETPLVTGGPYDSLNVGTNPTPSVGTSLPTNNDAYLDSTWSGAYCNGALGTGSFRLDAGCWTGYLPAFKVEAESPFVRSAEITSPLSGAEVFGMVSFDATLTDKDQNDNVQWAVRKGTCAAGTGTVIGNVDGKSNEYTWDHTTFHASADTSSWEPGNYCFIFNPTESTGDTPIRLTRNFVVIDTDSDNDGVLGAADYCPNTEEESFNKLGTNRLMWDGEQWVTSHPTKSTVPKEGFTMEYTNGCNCTEILNELSAITGESFDGHYKFGCSQSILEDWNKGYYMTEHLTIPVDTADEVHGTKILNSSYDYKIKISGTADAQVGNPIYFDAEYSNFPSVDGTNWVDGVTTYEVYTTNLLDLKVNGNFVDWGVFNPTHVYETEITGTNSPIFLNIYDEYYPNNTGNLSADIFVKLY